MVKLIANTNSSNTELFTVEFDFPKPLQAQFNTHGMICRNTQSSRAVPSNKLSEVPDFVPKKVGLNKKGMVPKTYLKGTELVWFQDKWENLRRIVELGIAQLQMDAKEKFGRTIAKEIINRPLDPFKMTRVVATGAVTDLGWLNFFKLRNHEQCQGDFQIVAKAIQDLYSECISNRSNFHLPYSNPSDKLYDRVRLSVANCAAVSYRNRITDLDRADRIINKLIRTDPKHASPFHHQGFSIDICHKYFKLKNFKVHYRDWPHLQAQFLGTNFIQLRKLYEFFKDFNLKEFCDVVSR